MKTCKKCGKTLIGRQKIFCSNLCSRLAIAESGKTGGWNREPPVERICKLCKKHFFVQPSMVRQNRAIYCSRECQHQGVMLKRDVLDFSQITEADKWYMAGFIDADGHISKPSSQFTVEAVNTHKGVIDWFQEKLPAYITYTKSRRKEWKDKYVWRIRDAFGCYQFLVFIEPCLKVKKPAAQKLIKFLRDKYHFD